MNDERLQHQISLVLRTGITVSGILMITGFVLTVINGGTDLPPDLRSGWHIFAQLYAERGLAGMTHPLVFLYSGIIALMLTPIFRVIFTIIGFSLEKDWRYVFISSLVLFVIAISIAFSITH